MTELLIYGAYGYVGELIARESVSRGLSPVLAGRDGSALADLGADLERPTRQFPLEDPAALPGHLEGVDCVLNCAGPFSNTAGPLVEACLKAGTDYVDITGEIPVIERLHDWDDVATDAGVTLLPSTGFSSVPMDCLAAHLADRLPAATALALGVDSFRPPSVGSLRTVIEGIESGGAVRRDGRLEGVPAAWRTRRIDFGRGTRTGVTMPMGDVSTAHYTTGVPDVEVYAVAPRPAPQLLKLHRYAAPVLDTTPVRRGLKALAGAVREGPSEGARERGSAHLWGEARTADERVVSRLRTPDPYVVTVQSAVEATERVLECAAGDGYQTPAGAFGPEFVLDLEDVDAFEDERGGERRVAAD